MEQKAINVAASLLIKDKKVMVLQRNENVKDPLKWEFPGGKLLDDEKFDEAIIREMREELSVDVNVIQEIGSVEKDYDNEVVMVMFILVEADPDKIKLKVHKDKKFVSYAELQSLDLLEPDRMFIEQYEKELKKLID